MGSPSKEHPKLAHKASHLVITDSFPGGPVRILDRSLGDHVAGIVPLATKSGLKSFRFFTSGVKKSDVPAVNLMGIQKPKTRLRFWKIIGDLRLSVREAVFAWL